MPREWCKPQRTGGPEPGVGTAVNASREKGLRSASLLDTFAKQALIWNSKLFRDCTSACWLSIFWGLVSICIGTNAPNPGSVFLSSLWNFQRPHEGYSHLFNFISRWLWFQGTLPICPYISNSMCCDVQPCQYQDMVWQSHMRTFTPCNTPVDWQEALLRKIALVSDVFLSLLAFRKLIPGLSGFVSTLSLINVSSLHPNKFNYLWVFDVIV